MRLISSDGRRIVDVGAGNIWKSVYSTVISCLGRKRKDFQLAYSFLETGNCDGKNGYMVARQINLIRDELSRYAPDKAVYDIDNLQITPPWKGNISPVVTSCANFFTTADGKDLFYEIVSILCYAEVTNTYIVAE